MKKRERKVIYYDKDSYKKHLELIAKLEQRETELVAELSTLDKRLIDGWMQPSSVSKTRQDLVAVRDMLYDLKHMDIEIIDNSGKKSDTVEIGNIYHTQVTYHDGRVLHYVFKLVSAHPSLNVPGQIDELTVSCPIGKAINGKKVGETTTFTIDGKVNTITIKEQIILNENDADENENA